MNRMTMYVFSAVVGLGLLMSCTAAQAVEIEYAYVDINVPFSGATDTIVYDINGIAIMVGTYREQDQTLQGFLFNPFQAKFTALKHTQCTHVEAHGINRSQMVVGTCWRKKTNGAPQAFFRVGTSWSFIVVPGAIESEALALNDTGQIAGAYKTAAGGMRRGFIFDRNTQQFTFLNISDTYETVITGITSSGILGGYVSDTSGYQGWHTFNGQIEAYVPPDPGQAGSQVREVGLMQSLVGIYWHAVGGTSFADLRGNFTPIIVPGAVTTQVQGFADNWMAVGGWLSDDPSEGWHGFVAIPQGPASDQMASAVARSAWVEHEEDAQ